MVASSPDMIASVSGGCCGRASERARRRAARWGGVYGCYRSVVLGHGVFLLDVAGFLRLQIHRGQLGTEK